jgi:hypothetical protein
MPFHEADVGLYFLLCRKPSPFAGMKMVKYTANGKTAMPGKMGEGNQRETHEI